MLRAALIGWGLGHVMLGDRRGWLLLLLELLAVAGIGLAAVALIEGTRWLAVFPALVGFVVIWLTQAFDAYRRAVRGGAQPGGEFAIVAVLPVALTVLTAFWIVGGRHGSPTATATGYVEAWVAGRSDVAAQLFATAPDETRLRADWDAARALLVERIGRARGVYGPESGLDPGLPFTSVRVHEAAPSNGRVAIVVDIVRSRRVQTTLLGVIPTAAQETVTVERALTIWLRLVPDEPPSWWPLPRLDSYVWKIDAIDSVH